MEAQAAGRGDGMCCSSVANIRQEAQDPHEL